MKKPRVNDFDPHSVSPLASPLDAMPPIQSSPSRDPLLPRATAIHPLEGLSASLPQTAAAPTPPPSPFPLNLAGEQYASMHTCMQACLRNILSQLDELKPPGVHSLSVRVTAEDLRWLRHLTASCDEEFETRFSQGLFIRLGLRLLKEALTYDPQGLQAILKEIM